MTAVGERQMPTIAGSLAGIYENHIRRYEYAAAELASGVAVDVGCGCGYGSLLFAPAVQYHGIDNSLDAIEYARAFYSVPQRHWHLGDVAHQGLPASIVHADRVIALEVIEHFPRERWEFVLGEFERVLAVHGQLVLSCPAGTAPPPNPRSFHAYEPAEAEIIGLVAARWSVIEVRYQPEGVPEIVEQRPDAQRYQLIVRAGDAKR